MADKASPVAAISINGANGAAATEVLEPIYGGYQNARSEVVLFAKDQAYGVNFKNHTLKQRPPLNPDAQARYDAVNAGEEFSYCNKTFHRLSLDRINEICESSKFRVGSRT